jgi:hypothetical protein
MKVERFNESVRNKNVQYKLYVYVGDRYADDGNDTSTIMNTHVTVNDALDELKEIVSEGLPGVDNKTYWIHDAYIEKVSRIKTDEIDAILKSKKYNL